MIFQFWCLLSILNVSMKCKSLRAWFLAVSVSILTLSIPYAVQAATQTVDIQLGRNGLITINGRPGPSVQAGVDLDNVTVVVADKTGESADQLVATLHLPGPVGPGSVNHKLIVINGVDATTSQLVDPQTIVYTASKVGPQATVSVIADFPKGYLDLPVAANTAVVITSLSRLWVILSILLPTLGLLVLLSMLAARVIDHRVPKRDGASTAPPNDLPPALISILYENRIEPEAIAATLIDLARRGYLSIFNKGDNFIFAKERDIDLTTASFKLGQHSVQLSDEEIAIAQKEGLRPFEKILLSKLFVESRAISAKEDVKVRVGHGLFSKKVAAIYEYLFGMASQLGYFVPGAASLHRKYLLVGWVLFAVGTIGFIVGAATLPDPKYFLLFWAGLIGIAYLVLMLAPLVPVRTSAGRHELGAFLRFRESLQSPSHELQQTLTGDRFLQLLPLAWALGVQESWGKACQGVVFHQPDWYFSSKQCNTTVEFVDDLSSLISFVAESFSASRERTLA